MTTSPEGSSSAPEAQTTREPELARAMASATVAIRQALAGLAPESCLSIEEVLCAFRGVQRVTDLRQHLRENGPTHRSLESNHAYSEYRRALRDWDRHLPRLHGWLLAERARLKSRSNHADLVREWMNADQQTR